MAVQTYNDRFLGNGKVPGGGSVPTKEVPSGGKSQIPKTVAQTDGTENYRAETQTKQAPILTSPTGSKSQIPPAVNSYEDGEV